MQIRAPEDKQEPDQALRQEATEPVVEESSFYERMVAARGKSMTYLQGRYFARCWNVRSSVQPATDYLTLWATLPRVIKGWM